MRARLFEFELEVDEIRLLRLAGVASATTGRGASSTGSGDIGIVTVFVQASSANPAINMLIARCTGSAQFNLLKSSNLGQSIFNARIWSKRLCSKVIL